MTDEIDRKILAIIQKNARASNEEIAARTGMSPGSIVERIERLEEQGIINGYEARLSPLALGQDLAAFVFVNTDRCLQDSDTAELLAKIPEVQEVHKVAGEECFLLKVRVGGSQELGRLVREKIEPIGSVCSAKVTVVLKTVKETAALPLR